MAGPPTLTDIFVQVIRAPVDDAEQVRAVYHRWFDDLAPDAEGWLASTAGITEDGGFFALVRFASEEVARRNSQRDAQGAWWEEFSSHLAGEAEFDESDRVATFGDGRPDGAGFLHVVRGRASGLEDAIGQVAEHEEHHVYEHHLPVLGGLLACHPEGRFTELNYYGSTAEARGEDGHLPGEGVTMIERVADHVIEAEHLHLEDPWLHRH